MKYAGLCRRCMNHKSSHPIDCRCVCHFYAVLHGIQYSMKTLGRKISDLSEALDMKSL